MKSVTLKVAKAELLGALNVLSVTRKRRFTSTVPVWLRFDEKASELQISEDRGAVEASVPAQGTWPPAGATVNLYGLRRAAEQTPGDMVTLYALADRVTLGAGLWQVDLPLLPFGPESGGGPPTLALPLFRWAHQSRSTTNGPGGKGRK